jgi:hypothetical protein
MSKKNALVAYNGGKLVVSTEARKARAKEISDFTNAVKKTMNSNLLKAADAIRKGVDGLVSRGFDRVWTMGEYLKKLDTDVDTFESGAVQKIAAYLRYSPEMLYKWLRFHEDYTKDQVKELTEMRMKLSGNMLSWEHTNKVTRLADPDLRMQLLEVAAENDLTPEELDALIREEFSPNSGGKRGGGRPTKVPSTYTARLENLSKLCHILVRNDKDMWRNTKFGFLQSIDDVPADKLAKLLPVMDKEAIKVATAIEKLTEVHKELLKARAMAADRIEEQAKATGNDEAHLASGKGKKGKKDKKDKKANAEETSSDSNGDGVEVPDLAGVGDD